MTKYRKQPVVIDAVQLTWENWDEVCRLVGVGAADEGKPHGVWVRADGSYGEEPEDMDHDRIGLLIPTLEGEMLGTENDWIIKGVQGEIYPCKPDIFEQTYELAEDAT